MQYTVEITLYCEECGCEIGTIHAEDYLPDEQTFATMCEECEYKRILERHSDYRHNQGV